MMRELSLFTGAGGGLLGTKLLGWTHIGYVEFNEYCQRVIRQRIDDGILDEAPIFTDIREFIQSGAADQYRGIADVVTAGFPCQPFSTAARGRNDADKDMWPETIKVVERVQPAYVFAENVSNKAMQRARLDLISTGYQVRRARVCASSVGAVCRRPREWLVANIDGYYEPDSAKHEEVEVVCSVPRLGWWDAEYRGSRVVSRASRWVDRARVIGNGQIPAVVRAAWEILSD